MYVKLPDGHRTLASVLESDDPMSSAPATTPTQNGPSHPEDQSIVSQSQLVDHSYQADSPVTHVHSLRPKAQKKKTPRNNPLRHYRRRKKKTKIKKLKIKPMPPRPGDYYSILLFFGINILAKLLLLSKYLAVKTI